MSKIPPANPKKKRFFDKAFWISFAISFGAAATQSVVIGLIEYYAQSGAGYVTSALAICVDAFALSGLLMCLFFLMQYFSTLGAFDFLAYSMKTLIYTIFKPHFKAQGFPATYYDYKVMKDRENRKPILAILFIGLIFLLAGVILLIVYKSK